MKQERNALFDIARGLGILLIFWAHCGIWGPLGVLLPFVIVFHVPLFFFISGYFLKEDKPWKEYFSGKAKRLLKPYYIWGALALGVYLMLPLTEDSLGIEQQLLYYISGTRYSTYIFTGALWFLTALFSTSVLGFFVAKQSIKIQVLISSICILVCTFFGLVSILKGESLLLPMNFDAALFMLPIYLLGKNYNRIKNYLSFKWSRFIIALILLIGSVVLTYILTHGNTISYHKGYYGFAPISLMATLSGIYVVWNVAVYINDKVGDGIKSKLSWIGVNSMTFYIIHQQFILHPMNSLDILVSIPILDGIIRFLVCIIVSYFFTLFANKYLKWSLK